MAFQNGLAPLGSMSPVTMRNVDVFLFSSLYQQPETLQVHPKRALIEAQGLPVSASLTSGTGFSASTERAVGRDPWADTGCVSRHKLSHSRNAR